MPSLIRWATEADRKIGSYYDYERKVEVLKVTDCKVEVPLGAVHVIAIIMGDNGCDCDLFFKNNYSMTKTTLTLSETEVFYWTDGSIFPSDVNWEIQNNNIIFESNFDGQYVTVFYLSYCLDKDGFVLVNENNIEAISLYLKLKLSELERWREMKSKKYTGFLNTIINDLRTQTRMAIMQARAESGKPTPSQQERLAEIMENPITGRSNYTMNLPIA